MLQIERHLEALENISPQSAGECWIGEDTGVRGHDHPEGMIAKHGLFCLYVTQLKSLGHRR